MKKILMFVVAAALCLPLTACGAAGANHAPATEPPEPAAQEVWTYELSIQTMEDEVCAEDGRVVARSAYDLPVMTALHPDGTPYDLEKESGAAVTAARNFQAYFSDSRNRQQTWFLEMAEGARTEYADAADWSDSPWENDDYAFVDEVKSSFWQNDHIACITQENYTFSGGAHGYGSRTAATFDMSTGKSVAITDMVSDYAGLCQAVDEEILQQIEKKLAELGEGAFFSDYPEAVKDWVDRSVFFDDEGITVVFAVYDIAPYAAGEQAFSMSYEFIAPYLNDYGRQMLELD
jgi:hypothetical protein